MKIFKAELDQNLKNNSGFEYSQFQNNFISVFYEHTPLKEKP